VVGATGVINTLADPLIKYWQYDQLSSVLQPYQGKPAVPEAERGSVQGSLDVALRHVPGKELSFIAFPGTAFSSPHHNTVFLRGNEPFTARLIQPVLVDAKTNEVTAAPPSPWYINTLLVSQPLHFGDYGGRPMQIVWAVLDIATIIVLGSGLYLWLAKPQGATRRRREESAQADESAVVS